MSESTAERWLPVPGHEFYEVSDHSRVRSIDRIVWDKGGWYSRRCRGRVLKPWPVARGHLAVGLGASARSLVHRLVLEAFVGPRPAGMQGLHNDDDKLNNHVANLRWGTQADNARDAVRNKTNSRTSQTHCKRSHLLADPNLAEWMKRRGYRNCLACARSHAVVYKARTKGVLLDQQPIADAYYAEIMRGQALPPVPAVLPGVTARVARAQRLATRRALVAGAHADSET